MERKKKPTLEIKILQCITHTHTHTQNTMKTEIYDLLMENHKIFLKSSESEINVKNGKPAVSRVTF